MDFSVYKKSRAEIEKIQLKKIRHVVSEAYNKSSFYHGLYKNAGFHPDMLKSYQDIQKIPIVKRSAIKSTPAGEIVTRKDFSRLRLHTTSGSSGIPVRFYYTAAEDMKKNYGVLRAYITMGMRMRDRTVAFRDPIDIRKKAVYERFGFIPYDYYDVYSPAELNYKMLCSRYEKIDVLKGMPSDLLNLCYEIRRGSMHFPKVRLLISDSEVLDDFSRKFISDTIGREVLDFYGSVENGCIAFQIPSSKKYFISEDQVLLENKDGSCLAGDAVITNLRNTTFPIIRYQIGDVIEFGSGKSDVPGMNFRTIDRIYGKYLDFIVLPDKTIISPHVPKQELTHLKGIRRFQIRQLDFGRAVAVIEQEEGFTKETEKEILHRLDRAFKHQVECSVEYDSLSIKTNNKFKCIQSDIAQQFLSDMM